MKKIISILIIFLLIGAAFLSGCVNQKDDSDDGNGQKDLVNTIDEGEAYDILIKDILKPELISDPMSAFMLSEMLESGDEITSDSGETYKIDKDSWFVFIDDMPWAFYAHPVRYLIINAQDGSVQTIDEEYPPLINNKSLWDSSNHNRGKLKDIYPIFNQSVPINDTVDTGAPIADYGDAPDTQNAYYGISGHFPTYYNTTNSRVGYPGGHTLTVGQETLGLTVSAEIDANDPNDPDILPNLVDSDLDDGMYVMINIQNAQLSFVVSVSSNAPDVSRYINVLIDFDQNGSWMNGLYGTEWAVKNHMVNVSPGETKTISTPLFSWSNKTIPPSPCWMRVALTRAKVNETLFDSVGGWDGSGQFEFGEIEDHILYLTDDIPEPEDIWPPWPKEPPTGGEPDPKQPSGPNPPGPTSGPCGTTVNYHSIIINGGDSSDHLGKGISPASDAVSTMTELLDDQGYSSAGTVGPGSNSLAEIQQAFDNLKNSVKCGDHVLIYIIGHGKSSSKGGGVTLRGTDGKTDETMKPSDLSNLLGSIPACPDEDCDVEGKCCHVTVVIESCYAGNFNVDGVKGTGRTVIGSSDDEPASAAGGGVFTSGFSDASSDEDRDTDDDGTVTPMEAFEGAEDSVSVNNKKTGRSQEPWSDSQECECKCPCSPGIDVDKWVWDDDWVSEMDAEIGQQISFRCVVESTGKCRNVSDLELVDTLPICLEYGSDSEITYLDSSGQENTITMSPQMSDAESGGMDLTFDLGSEIGLFAPGETVTIDYTATTLLEGDNTNILAGSAQCTYDPSITVTDLASVTINVASEPDDTVLPPVDETISVFLEGYGECSCAGEECTGSLIISSYGANDLSGGNYPITEVTLSINGVEKEQATLDSSPFTGSFEEVVSDCYSSYEVMVTATNSAGQILSSNATLDLEMILNIDIEATAESYYEGDFCESFLNVTFEATDPSGENPILDITMTKVHGGESEDIPLSQPLGVGEFMQEEYYQTDCGETFIFELTVTTNKKILSTSLEVTTPSP